MSLAGSYVGPPYTIAFIGNYVPRQCGIATFTTDLLEAVAVEAPNVNCWAVAMSDVPEGYPYPSRVRFELNQKNASDYRLAADFLNMNLVDAVCLQHEFGIFGGQHGSLILQLLDSLRMPIVTTLHTVLNEPDRGQKTVFEELCRLSDRLVVMSHKAEAILREVYNIADEKIMFVHHGIPDVPFVDPSFYKDQFGVEGRKVILTFGLVSPGKGIEHMIDALPRIVSRDPKTAYLVVGATHPHVKREEGESYRLGLQLRASDQGVEDHLIFHNRFVDLKELCEFLGAADIYVTPYLNKRQIVSGTLAYALGAGKATISTPYWYATEMLAEERGRLVPFQDPDALADQVIDLLHRETERHAMRKRAYTFCRSMIWKEVARRYLEIFSEAKSERERQRRTVFHNKTLEEIPYDLPQVKLDHLKLLTDDVGILQHAKFVVPDRSHGYCTDDNARALIAVLMAYDLLSEDRELVELACRYLAFVNHAFDTGNGRFHNLMGYDRKWLDQESTDDTQGRAIWGLGMAVALAKSESLVGAALNIFEQALPMATDLRSPRAVAFALVGIHAYLRRFSGDSEARRVRATLAEFLFGIYQAQATEDWPWIEDTVTYSNGKIPQALLLSGQWLQRGDMTEASLRSLAWLLEIQTDPEGHFVPIGNHGWFSRDGHRARFDQQPVEAQNMIEACIEAYRVTGDREWILKARCCFDWFLGRNDLHVPLYDYKTGGCCDGLTPDGPNQNRGAESTVAWLVSLLTLNLLANIEVLDRTSAIRED
jgi:glycosyltransferase involved in cell wall biosynthesis